MDFHIVRLSTTFRWRGKEYTIDGCGMRGGIAYASTIPDEPDLVAEIKRGIEADHGLKLYLASGYTCFIEDHHRQ